MCIDISKYSQLVTLLIYTISFCLIYVLSNNLINNYLNWEIFLFDKSYYYE